MSENLQVSGHWHPLGLSPTGPCPQVTICIVPAQNRTFLFNVLISLEITGGLLTPTLSAAASALVILCSSSCTLDIVHSAPLPTLAPRCKPGQTKQVVTKLLPNRYNADVTFTPNKLACDLWTHTHPNFEFSEATVSRCVHIVPCHFFPLQHVLPKNKNVIFFKEVISSEDLTLIKYICLDKDYILIYQLSKMHPLQNIPSDT